MAEPGPEVRRAHSVEGRPVLRLAESQSAGEIQQESVTRGADLDLEFDAGKMRLAPVPEEVEILTVLVALDEIGDPVAEGVEPAMDGAPVEAEGEVRLERALRAEVGVSVHHAAAGEPAVVAIREGGIAEAAGKLAGKRDPGRQVGAQGEETAERSVARFRPGAGAAGRRAGSAGDRRKPRARAPGKPPVERLLGVAVDRRLAAHRAVEAGAELSPVREGRRHSVSAGPGIDIETAQELGAEFEAAVPERPDAARPQHEVMRRDLGIRGFPALLAPRQQAVGADEPGGVEPREPPARGELVVGNEPGRILEGIGSERRGAPGAPHVPRGVDLESQPEQAARDLPQTAEQESVILGARPGNPALGARVLGKDPAPRLGEQTGLENGPRDLGPEARFRKAGAPGGAGPSREGVAGNRAPRPGVDDAAESVRAVGHRGRTAHHLDGFEEERIEEGGARPGAALAGDPRPVQEEHRPAPREAANRGDPGVEVAVAPASGNRLQHVGEPRRLADADRLAGNDRRGAPRRGVGVRHGAAGDGDALLHPERLDAKFHFAPVEGLDDDGGGVALARKHHQHVEGGDRVR